ncbi:MAG: hypothetical protein HQ478_15375 [Chloroflexi bacterium]|nr:hypothetical protein [Chloroflexota bacterium]
MQRNRGEAKPPAPPTLSPQEQAAIAYARDNREAYPKRWREKDIQYTVVNAERRADGNMLVKITYRPSGTFKGRPGEESLLMNASGGLVERTQIGAPQEAYPWILTGMTVVSVISALVLGYLIWTDEERSVNPLYVSGRILWVQIEEPFLVPSIHYQNPSTDGELLNWEIAPKNPANVMAMVKVTLINQKTAQARVIIDEKAARLISTDGFNYSPTNIVTASKTIESIDGGLKQDNFVGLWRPATINSGENLIGWMVFEVPPGTEFTEFRWEASDNITIRF